MGEGWDFEGTRCPAVGSRLQTTPPPLLDAALQSRGHHLAVSNSSATKLVANLLEPPLFRSLRQRHLYPRPQLLQPRALCRRHPLPLPRPSRDRDFLVPCSLFRVPIDYQVDLVQRRHPRPVRQPQLLERLLYRVYLFLRIPVCYVDHVQQQRRLLQFLEGRPEGGDKLRRQLLDE